MQRSGPKISLNEVRRWSVQVIVKTTLNIDDEMLNEASRLTGVKEKTSLVTLGLQALIAQESRRKLSKLGGTEKKLRAIPRRRPWIKEL